MFLTELQSWAWGESGRPRGCGDEHECVSARPVGQRRPGLCLRLAFRESAGAATGLFLGPGRALRVPPSCFWAGLSPLSSPRAWPVPSVFILPGWRWFSAEPQACLRFLGGGAGCCLRLVCRGNTRAPCQQRQVCPSAPLACALQVSLLSKFLNSEML